ncbi:WbqC family protein [Aeromonas veronii]|uniref:WbqC family protein n=1 Tax=Aeromonas veronii TaxID=654 RepID=UPI0009704EDE|nr:WbqC family protein [Aeromonas veronii]
MRLAVMQSNYIPWKGYFDLMAFVDKFIILDDVQYTKNDWRNRNLIKTASGVQWLTIPVKSKFGQKIKDTIICGDEWRELHWKSLLQNYRRAPHFHEISGMLEKLYLAEYCSISEVNKTFISFVCSYLGIETEIIDSSCFELASDKNERLISLCKQSGASEYVSGPAAKSYIDCDLFINENVELTWFSYDGYPVYKQLYGDFVHGVSVLDLLFNCGDSSCMYMKHVKNSR